MHIPARSPNSMITFSSIYHVYFTSDKFLLETEFTYQPLGNLALPLSRLLIPLTYILPIYHTFSSLQPLQPKLRECRKYTANHLSLTLTHTYTHMHTCVPHLCVCVCSKYVVLSLCVSGACYRHDNIMREKRE